MKEDKKAKGVPLYEAMDDILSNKLKELSINVKDQPAMTQRDVIDAIGALAEVVKANRKLPGSESVVAAVNEKIRELIPLFSGVVVREELSEELAAKYPYSLQQINSFLRDAVLILKDSYAEELIVEMLDLCTAHKMNLNFCKLAMLQDIRRRENYGRL